MKEGISLPTLKKNYEKAMSNKQLYTNKLDKLDKFCEMEKFLESHRF